MKKLNDLTEYLAGEVAPTYTDGTLREDLILKDDLKRIAIEHLKHHSKDDGPSSCTLTGWIEDFFGITKEDLK